MQPIKYRVIRTAPDYKKAFGIRDYAALGRTLAKSVGRERPFSRSYVHHVLSGNYAPSDTMAQALAVHCAGEIQRRTRGKYTASLYINGRWKVTLRKDKAR